MAVTVQQTDGNLCLVIEGELTIYAAAELKAQLLPWFTPTCDIELDLTRISEVDSAGVQLLLLMRREVMAYGQSLRLLAASPAVRDALTLCNIWSLFAGPLDLA